MRGIAPSLQQDRRIEKGVLFAEERGRAGPSAANTDDIDASCSYSYSYSG